jgi:hypothetical protein
LAYGNYGQDRWFVNSVVPNVSEPDGRSNTTIKTRNTKTQRHKEKQEQGERIEEIEDFVVP